MVELLNPDIFFKINSNISSSVPNESNRVKFESILKYYLYNGVYPINCLKYIIYIMRVYASLMRVKIQNTKSTIINYKFQDATRIHDISILIYTNIRLFFFEIPLNPLFLHRWLLLNIHPILQ